MEQVDEHSIMAFIVYAELRRCKAFRFIQQGQE